MEPIAIIGFGCRFPGGSDTPSKLWSMLCNPENLSRKPASSRFNVDAFYHPVGTHHGTTNATRSYWLEDADRSNVAQFDAGFFNIQPAEVDAMDPQQRLLMEVTYDGLCAAGLPMEKLRGSDTAVFVGLMCDDYQSMLTSDWETFPRYTVTGVERGVLANRLSYFFDWHGPSMTIDTACSSSMVALDQAVQVLRSGKSKMAVAAGANLILTPIMHINEASLGMLSPSGRCAMWDESADGYTRGEGVAAVFVKTLSQALADKDPIQCILRETGVNQDGRTSGLTMPSSMAQAQLIRECYARIGLDPVNNPLDRPQFFQAHGTGTQAGDPQEAEAISTALFPSASSFSSCSSSASGGQLEQKLAVGSIKTVIGHTEGTAGVASVIATSLALKNGIIPPNLHFQSLNPKVAPFFENLEIPTAPIAWPAAAEGQIKRASVNSFGFGGTNAHCILEEYVAETETEAETGVDISPILFTPLTFSAHCETSLRTMLSWHLDFLKTNREARLTSVAYTLQHRRSTLAYRTTVAATTIQDAIGALERRLVDAADAADDLSTRHSSLSRPPKVLGIFTGQGAQWARMGAQLIEASPFAASRIADLDAALHSLPNSADRPAWSLREQLLADEETSRIAEAALSQPLCTAVQVILVDVLRAAGISFSAVVGHSSGEIAAAYASGLVTAGEAIRIAYLRGLHAKQASSPSSHSPRGAMIAVGTTAEDAQRICAETFAGRLQVAAVNASSSVTLSGDEDAVEEAEQLFKAQGTFARKLKVDTAYHSAHMRTSAAPYLASLEHIGLEPPTGEKHSGATWFSSVYDGKTMNKRTPSPSAQYWVDNMCNTVLFAGAIAQAVETAGEFDMAVEVGPHPALQGPALASLGSVPYTGLLSRGKDDIEHLSAALGAIWTQLGYDSVQFSAVQALLSGTDNSTKVLDDLPPYPFEHQRVYGTNSRIANRFKNRSMAHAPNPVLGIRCAEAATPGEIQWRNVLRPKEISWLKGHMLQGQTVFPATGYVSMAIEAIKAVALDQDANALISVFKLCDVAIGRAITFDDDDASVETIFSLSSASTADSVISAEWACYSVADGTNTGSIVLNAKGRATCHLSLARPDTLPLCVKAANDVYGLVDVEDTEFYDSLAEIGYGYAPPFRGLSNIRRKLGYSVGTLSDQSGSAWEDNLVLHPGLLDSALQTIFAAWAHPGDSQIWSMHVPVAISAITVNPHFTPLGRGGKQSMLRFETCTRSKSHSKIVGDIYLHDFHSSHGFLKMEGAAMVPFSPATSKNDVPMFSHFQYTVASPDGELAAASERMTPYEVQVYKDIDRVSCWYARNASLSIPVEDRHSLLPHYRHYLQWCDRMVAMVSRGDHPKVSAASCNADTQEDVARILSQYPDRKDIRFVEVVGNHLVDTIRRGASMLEHMNKDGLLRAFYEENALCAGPTTRWLARILSQISSRYPRMNILEVGAGTGGSTSAVLDAIGDGYASYTFTDISSGFFLAAEERFAQQSDRMLFKTFNMGKEPGGQGFVEGEYDVVVAVNVLHVSVDMEATLANVRRLLKPGGFLVVGELTSTDLLFTGMTVGTLPGWWIGVETGRPWGPLLDLSQWDAALKKTGFAGIDTVTPDISASLPFSVFVAQAVDDKVLMLRNPLDVKKHPGGIDTEDLAIIGGTTQAVRRLGWEVSDVLSYRFHNKQFFNTVEDFASSDMAASATAITVLSLTDADGPYLEDLTAGKLEALKTLFSVAGTLIWLTCGSREDSPYSYMMLGLINTVKSEYVRLNAQMYDLDPITGIEQSTATDLAQMLLREVALSSWGRDPDVLLWTAEPQVFVADGRQLITRLVPDSEKNKRYNARRRDVFAAADPARDRLELVGSGQGEERRLELHEVPPLRLALGRATTTNCRTVRITLSLLQSLAIGSAGFFRLCVGVDVETGEAVLALSGSGESPADIPARCCITISEAPTPSTLASVAARLIADRVLSLTPSGATLLVNEPDSALQWALQANATGKNVKTVFTTAKIAEEATNSHLTFLHPDLPQHVIQSVIPSSAAVVFVHLSRGVRADAVRDAVAKYLPPACLTIHEETLLSHEVQLFSQPDLAPVLQSAWNSAHTSEPSFSVDCIPLEEASRHSAVGEPLAVLDWTASQSVSAKVQPVDSGTLFRADRTYLFVGMAGELGQSLAAWMIAHGARYVVLTSRTPKVHPQFVQDMRNRYDALVQGVSLDVTSRESLWSVHAAVTATLPPIAGVVHGAMILDDEIFANMTLDQFSRVAQPKVVGAQLLDELFHHDAAALDFFICCSSISAVIGWHGQSNYVAANDYMSSLMSSRRKRGLVGSTINIPAVLGVGYAANSDAFSFEYIRSIGYSTIGEEDFHALFAEAVLSGRPGQSPNVTSQVVMGINHIPADLEVREAHRRDVKLARFVLHEDGGGMAKAEGGRAVDRVVVQLQSAKTQDQAYAISRDAFLAYLKRLLRILGEENIQDSGTLMEQGVDSLVAVDLRSWFLKEMEVDVPTLKILGGGTIADLVKAALERRQELASSSALMSLDPPMAKEVQTPQLTISSPSQSDGSPILIPRPSSTCTSSGPDSDFASPPAYDVLDNSCAISVTEMEFNEKAVL